MFNFHVVTELHSAPDDPSADTLVQWQTFDGARATFEAARDACDNFVDVMADGWVLDCLTIWPDDDNEDAQLAAVSEHELSLANSDD